MSTPQNPQQTHRGPVPVQPEWLLEETMKSRRVSPTQKQAAAPSQPQRTGPQLKIAIVGTHGIPANYGGFETFVEQLSVRLAARGHEVTVYCRKYHIKWPSSIYKGVRLVKLPTIRTKQLDTLAHTFFSMLHGFFRKFDIVYICGVGNSPLIFMPRLTGKPTLINVDGADWQRGKWGRFASWYLRRSESIAAHSKATIISDSRTVERYYKDNFNVSSLFIPYGSDVPILPPGPTLAKFGLKPNGYLLWVGRLVPENNAHDVIAAYQRLGGPATGLQLCILGDSPYSTDYITDLKANAGPGVVFTGFVFGEGYQELGANASIFVFACGVGGTHPALLEAMARGNCIVYNDFSANLETVADAGIPYHGEGHADALTETLGNTLANPALIEEYRRRATHRAQTVYSWEAITTQYEQLFYQLARKK
jgi:glycosyltransferase involved in cell wall biosynthesis